MAREVIIKLWCDPCLAVDEHTDGDEYTIGINTARPMNLTLCEVHEKELLAPLARMLTEMGQPAPTGPQQASAPSRRPGSQYGNGPDDPQVCQMPGCGVELKNKSSLSSHVRQRHDIVMKEYRVLTGQATPQDERDERPRNDAGLFPDSDEVLECDVEGCDKSYSYATNAKPVQALAVHKAKAHGIRGARHN